jgi:D-threo-aldose 1-dehydrogenase
MQALQKRTFARSGLVATNIGFGGAPLGDLFSTLPEDQAVATVLAALDGGINLIDVSPLYGHGLAEHRIGTALRRWNGSRPILSTKVGRVTEPFAPRGNGSGYHGGLPHGARFDYSADGVMRSLEQSLLRLGTDRVDIALIHDVDVWTHGADRIGAVLRQAIDEAYPTLERLRASGVVRSIGVGVNEADICARFARDTDIDSVLLAGRYSLLEQPALDEFLPLAQARQISVMLGGVFNSGILATGAVPGAKYNYRPAPEDVLQRVAAIEAICRRHDVPLRVAALQFALAHPAVTCVVMGAVKPAEVTENIAAAASPVPAALFADLKAAGLLNAAAPTPGS